MKLNRVLILSTIALSACNSQTSTPTNNSATPVPEVSGLTNGSSIPAVTGNNVMKLTVNGSNCAPNSYANKPCASVTICSTGSATDCVTVNDLLVDTGSYGLRVFKSAIPNLNLTQVMSKQNGALTECARFGDGSGEWGPVKLATLTLGNEAPITIPIQVLDPSFGVVPKSCADGSPDASVAAAGFNGILGVGVFAVDCGAGCNGSHTSNQMYFSCTGGNTGVGSGAVACPGGSTNATSDQVQNPVSSLATDNNGLLISLPAISSLGTSSVEGYMILGVGTQANNTPNGVTVFGVNPNTARFKTTFDGSTYSSFIDSGSNGLYFSPPTSNTKLLPTCSTTSPWFCPSSVTTLTATNIGITPIGGTGAVNFQVGNANTIFNSGNRVFNNLGGDGGSMFDYGLPFYFGRNIYLGIETKVSSLGTGPYWAY